MRVRKRVDLSHGYDEFASDFMRARNARIGPPVVRAWAESLPAGADVLDVGCGNGSPITDVLVAAGLRVHAIDASPRMVAAFRSRFPDVPARCEAVETSDFFGRTFDAVIAWGVMFLLDEDVQKQVIRRIPTALREGGRFVFTAPRDVESWNDSITGRASRSLGRQAYASLVHDAGFDVTNEFDDEGDNHYIDARSADRRAGDRRRR